MRVPTAEGHVQAPGEGDPVVDPDDLLVLRGAEGVRLVVADVEPRVLRPSPAPRPARAIVDSRQRDQRPLEYPDLELRLRFQGSHERVTELKRRLGLRVQVSARVDFPAGDHDRALSTGNRGRERSKVRPNVDQNVAPRSTRRAPAVAAHHQDRLGTHLCIALSRSSSAGVSIGGSSSTGWRFADSTERRAWTRSSVGTAFAHCQRLPKKSSPSILLVSFRPVVDVELGRFILRIRSRVVDQPPERISSESMSGCRSQLRSA